MKTNKKSEKGNWKLRRNKPRALSIFQFPIAIFLILFLAAQPLAHSQSPAPQGNSLPEVLEAIESARVTTRILYITAHPDDEPGGVLAYLARGLHADVALLSLTRGEGGQNALGPEQAPQLGVIRTQELLAATHVYGTKLFFTRAQDFGYTKSADEALRVWGEPVLRDMVQVIRTLRPHVVINNWHGVRSGHGHHQASGILTPQAVAAAADENKFPDAGPAWKTQSVLGRLRDDNAQGFVIPMNDVAPLWGKTWGEIGIEGYSNHRSQGIAAVRTSPFFRREMRLNRLEGQPPDRALLAAPLAALAAKFPAQRAQLLPVLQSLDGALVATRRAVLNGHWAAAARALAPAAKQFSAAVKKWESANTRNEDLLFELNAIQRRLHYALARVAGMNVPPVAEQSEIASMSTYLVQLVPSCRTEVRCSFAVTDRNASARPADSSGIARYLMTPSHTARAGGTPPGEWMNPEQNTVPPLEITATVEGFSFSMRAPVQAVKSTSTSVETVAPMVVPSLTVTAAPKQVVLRAQQAPRHIEILARVVHYATLSPGVKVGVEVPAGWTTPELQAFDFARASAALVRMTVGLPEKLAAGDYMLRPYAEFAGQKYLMSLTPLVTLPSRMWLEPAEIHVRVMDVAVPENLRVGYVAAENDAIPHALRQIGVQVELLDEVALAYGDLAKFDAICVGIRAYELRADLIRANQRLLDYTAAGGTLVVQYQRESVWNQLKPAPFPARSSQNDARVADETAPVRVLAPEHALLNFPNKIRPEDFDGWVQERGLYFWTEFDPKYTPLLAMKDPSDKEEFRGTLVAAPLGKGMYIFTGLSFFRQLPEGVPGAYRLFVNLLSQSKKP